MKKNDQLIGYVLRRGLIAVCATGFGLLWKHVWPDKLPPEWLVVAAIVMAAITVIALFAVDFLLDWVYAVSRKLRRWLALLDRSYIEGAWVDVGLVGRADGRRALNFSFITIKFVNGQHKVSGRSWIATSEHSLTPWSSEFSSWDRDTLTFWFNDDTGPGREIASRASYRVTDWARRTPTHIAGAYKEPGQAVETQSVRVTQAFLDDFAADNASGGRASVASRFGADFDLDALDATKDGALALGQFELRRELAKWHLRRVAVQENLDPSNWTAKNRVRFSRDYADWYGAFLEASEHKAAEFALLREFLDELIAKRALDRDVKTVLDIGPGNGRLTSAALDKLKVAKFQKFRYTALEPSFALGTTLRDQLSRDHPNIEFRLISQRWSEYIAWPDAPGYDLALAFHSLYFGDKPDEEIARLFEWVASGKLAQGAILFHTDWEKSQVLKKLADSAPGAALCDVVGRTEQATAGHAVKLVAERSGELIVNVPPLSNAQWKQLQEPSNLVNDEAVRKVAQLLAFLINMAPNDDGSWEAATHVLRESLATAPHLSLPLRLQYFRKA